MATPIEWLNEFQVNTGSAATGNQDNPQIIGLASGNFLVAWEESASGSIGTSAGTDIIGKIYNAEGDLVRNAYRLNLFANVDDERDFDIAATNDGGFIMVYVDDDISNVNQTAIIWERFDADGNQIDSLSIASESVAADFLRNPQVAVNQFNNDSVVTFTDDVGTDTDIRGVVIDSTGTITAAEFDAAQNSADFDRDGDVAILSNGNYVSVYEEEDGGTTSVEFQRFDSSGVKVGGALNAGDGIDPQVASLRNGNFVVTWDNGGDIEYRIYTPTGTAVTGVLTAAGTTDSENEPAVVALPDGDFVIVWDNDTDGTLQARRFNPDGTGDGFTFTVENVGTTSPDIGVTGDGRILFTWEDDDGLGEVFASIWDPRTSPIEAGDYQLNQRNFVESTVVTARTVSSTVNGDSFSNTIRGQNGNDVLNGGNGNDTINGGGGNDTINGGLNVDTVNGAAGDDLIIIEDGNFIDNVDGGTGNDTLDLSAISDFAGDAATIDFNTNFFNGFGGPTTIFRIEEVIGTQFGDSIVADGQRDTIRGQNGNDNLFGGGGPDRLFGEGGDDTLTGEGGGDILNGGGGDDQLFGNGAADDLSGGGGDDTLTGGAGADTLTGGAGKDRLTGNNGGDIFNFDSVNETQAGAPRDIITDFDQLTDVIDLSGIDANTLFGGNQAFTFVGGGAYSGSGGELRFSSSGGNTIVRGDVNGDTVDDLQIQLVGSYFLNAGDFVL